MRLFFASFLGSENMRAYETMVADLSAAWPHVIRPIPAGSHHLTMTFLGDVDERELDKCREVLSAIEESAAIDYLLAAPRILYARRSPRLICADILAGAERISSLQAVLRDEIQKRFAGSLLRAQSPHITLARFKRHAHPRTARPVLEALSDLEDSRLPQADRLVSVHLVQSTLTASGPLYTSLCEARLRERD